MSNKKNLPSNGNRVDVFYGRKSTGYKTDEHEEEQNMKYGNDKQARSLPKQKRAFEEVYAALPQGEKTHKLVTIEEAESGYRPGKRDGYEEVIRISDTCGINRLYFNETRRIARNPEECGKIAQRLTDGRIDEIVMMNGRRFQRGDSAQLLLFLIEGGVGWMESADKGRDVSQGMLDKAKEGGSTGWAPIGYINVSDRNGKKSIELDPDAALKVKRLFLLAATGAYSLDKLTKEAKEMGLRTRPTKKHPKGLYPQKTTIAYMLQNPEYKGVKHYKDSVYPGQHPKLIEKEVWNKVQVETTKRSTNSERPKDVTLRELFVMAGCVKCGKCKVRSMSPYRVKKGRYIMYECKNPKTKCQNCINQEDLIAQLSASLEMLVISDDEHAYMRKTLKHLHEEESRQRIDEYKSLEREYQIIDQQIADVFLNIEEARRQGVYDTISMKIAQLRMKKDEIKIALDSLHDEGDQWIDHVIQCFDLAKLVHRAIQVGSPEVRQAVLKSLSSSYVVYDKALVCDWLSPFKERLEGDSTKWLPRLDSNQ